MEEQYEPLRNFFFYPQCYVGHIVSPSHRSNIYCFVVYTSLGTVSAAGTYTFMYMNCVVFLIRTAFRV